MLTLSDFHDGAEGVASVFQAYKVVEEARQHKQPHPSSSKTNNIQLSGDNTRDIHYHDPLGV